MQTAQVKIQHGHHHDPFEWLGIHPMRPGYVVRAFLPSAVTVELDGLGEMQRKEGTDIFEISITEIQRNKIVPHYQLNWIEKGSATSHSVISPYSFTPVLSEFDLNLFNAGMHLHIYRFLGARLQTIDGIDGCLFALWAPNVKRVSVIGDFNGWHGLRHPMRNRGASGVWELFIPGLHANDNYKFEILTQDNTTLRKSDPYARSMGLRPDTTSKVAATDAYQWNDQTWINHRQKWQWLHEPMSIYEVHAGSWKRHDNGNFLSYRELAEQLVPYVKNLGYTHIEFLPLTEHPLDESWGYQVSGYYAPTARHGSAEDLRYLIDIAHKSGIGIILDWVPAHFPRDEFALANFTGEACYEYGDPKKGEHLDWGTLIFNYGRNEVRNFLIANAVYWLEEFHIDGLRVDAVASMLYLDYSREQGQWSPNEHGGREHLEAIEFFKNLNEVVHAEFPGVVTLAEESTDWPMVSRPTDMGGLGFSMKWNMGWMHDSLNYLQTDPLYRRFHQNLLTFSQMYAYSENFVLPLSHDEVVHMKRSMLDKMSGDVWQKFANLRLLYAYQYAHPGKKLLFMGGEFGQWDEWNEANGLDWMVADMDKHAGLSHLIQDLNSTYRQKTALHVYDFEQQGFSWLSCDDIDNSVLAFVRRDNENFIVCVFNFTPKPLEGYELNIPEAGQYKEIFNSDASCYGGSDIHNANVLKTFQDNKSALDNSTSHVANSLTLTLPPLAAVLLEKINS